MKDEKLSIDEAYFDNEVMIHGWGDGIDDGYLDIGGGSSNGEMTDP